MRNLSISRYESLIKQTKIAILRCYLKYIKNEKRKQNWKKIIVEKNTIN